MLCLGRPVTQLMSVYRARLRSGLLVYPRPGRLAGRLPPAPAPRVALASPWYGDTAVGTRLAPGGSRCTRSVGWAPSA